MPRTLPWLSGASSTKSKGPAANRPPKRHHVEATPDHDKTVESRKAKSPRPSHHAPSGILSSSPPPELLDEESMRPSDGLWMMVEDELYQIAQQFTRHLHHAEYRRHQKQAAERNKQISISRPIDGHSLLSTDTLNLTELAEARRGAVNNSGLRSNTSRLSDKKDEPIDRGDDDEVNSEEEVIGDGNLASLMRGMSGGRISERLFLDGGYRQPATRAAAGFETQRLNTVEAHAKVKPYSIPTAVLPKTVPSETLSLQAKNAISGSDSDEGDLDGPSSKFTQASSLQALRIPPRTVIQQSKVTSERNPLNDAAATIGKDNVHTAKHPLRQTSAQWNPTANHLDQSPRVMPKVRSQAPAVLSRSRVKRPTAKGSQKRDSIKLEEIPTFLF